MEMEEPECNFKLDAYSDHVKAVLKEMITDSVFSDVTLVFGDLQIMKASRNILSVCSPVLKNILEVDPSKNPLLYLHGLKIAEIEAIIDFVIFGEVKVPQDQINDFLRSAENLEIRELYKREIEKTIPVEAEGREIIDTNSVILPSNDNLETKVKAPDYSCKLCDKDYTGSKWGKDTLKIHMRREHEKIRYPCNKCDFQAKGTSDLNKHIQAIHEGIKFECEYKGCNYRISRRSMLNYHVRFKHEGIFYSCDMCGERCMSPHALKSHVKHKHQNSFIPSVQAIKD